MRAQFKTDLPCFRSIYKENRNPRHASTHEKYFPRSCGSNSRASYRRNTEIAGIHVREIVDARKEEKGENGLVPRSKKIIFIREQEERVYEIKGASTVLDVIYRRVGMETRAQRQETRRSTTIFFYATFSTIV